MSRTPPSNSSSFTSVDEDSDEDHFEFHPAKLRPIRPSGTSRRVSILSAADLEEMARHSSDGSDFIDDRKEDDLTFNDWSAASSESDGGSEPSDDDERHGSDRCSSTPVAGTSSSSLMDSTLDVQRSRRKEASGLLPSLRAADDSSRFTPPQPSRTSAASIPSVHSTARRRESGHPESESSSGNSMHRGEKRESEVPSPILKDSEEAREGLDVVERKRGLFDESEDDNNSDDGVAQEKKYFDEAAVKDAEVETMDVILDQTHRRSSLTDENNLIAANIAKSPMVAQGSKHDRLFDSFEGLDGSFSKNKDEVEKEEMIKADVVEELSDSPVNLRVRGAGGRRLRKGIRRSSTTGSFLADQIRQSLSKDERKKKDCIDWGGAASLFSKNRRSEAPRRSSSVDDGPSSIRKAREAEEEEEGEIDEYGYTKDKRYARLPGGWRIERGKYDSLYDYQKDGVKWMYDLFKEGKGGILADIMGMGKTVQVCALLRGLLKGKLATRVLILCEKSLRDTWERETSQWSGNWHVTSLCAYNTASQREKKLRRSWLSRNCLIIANQTFIRDDNITLYSACGGGVSDRSPWDIIIYDEAQKMRNPNTALFQHATLMRAKSKLLLTGTPIQNTPCDLWALMEIAVPGLLKEFSLFKNSVADVIKRGNRRGATETQEREKDRVVEELNTLIYDYVLRREKYVDEITEGDVSKLEIILWIGLAEEQLAIYKEYINTRQVRRACSQGRDNRKGMHVLRCISTLRALCNHPVFLLPKEEQRWRGAFGVSPAEIGEGSAQDDLVGEGEGNSSGGDEDDDPPWIEGRDAALHTYNTLIRDLPQDDGRQIEALSSKLQVLHCLLRRLKEGGHRVLLFCPWTSMLDLVQFTILRTDGMSFLRIDGGTSSHDRQRKIRKFQESKKYFALVLSTQCGNVGLNLTAADRVVLISPSWNPSDDDQAVARAYRIGQRRDVIAYRLVCSGTIEERIFQREVAKIGDSKVILENKDQEKYFSEVDLKRLFEYTDPGDATAKDTLRDTADSASRTAMLEKLEDDLGGVASFIEQCDGMTIDFSDYGQLYKK